MILFFFKKKNDVFFEKSFHMWVHPENGFFLFLRSRLICDTAVHINTLQNASAAAFPFLGRWNIPRAMNPESESPAHLKTVK